MKKETGLLLILGTLMMFILTGCMYQNMAVNIGADGSGTVVITTGYDEAYYEALVEDEAMTQAEFEKVKQESIEVEQDGKVYYCTTEETEFSDTKELEEVLSKNEKYVYASTETFFMVNETDTEEAEDLTNEEIKELLYININVTFAQPIQKHIGGELSNGNKTITWDMDEILKGKDLYATTTRKAEKPATVNVVKNKFYKKIQTMKVKSGVGTVYMDDMLVTSGKTKAKNGKHTLLILNQNGTKKEFQFVVDTKAPAIKGVKNNKTYAKNVKLTFSDTESGIKSVTVNGKKISAKAIKNGYIVKKNGKYTVKVTDQAKNVKTVKFTIKKY